VTLVETTIAVAIALAMSVAGATLALGSRPVDARIAADGFEYTWTEAVALARATSDAGVGTGATIVIARDGTDTVATLYRYRATGNRPHELERVDGDPPVRFPATVTFEPATVLPASILIGPSGDVTPGSVSCANGDAGDASFSIRFDAGGASTTLAVDCATGAVRERL